MHIHTLRERLAALGANPGHAARVLRRWLQARPQEGARPLDTFLPKALVQALPALSDELGAIVTLRSRHDSREGAVAGNGGIGGIGGEGDGDGDGDVGPGGSRLLLALADGETVEAVLLPRGGLCVSTQVGCAVACRFCMTGQGGLRRQLGSAEIVAQVALARTLRPVHKVVFMGMGEPAHNLDAVLEAIDMLGHEGGIGHKQIVFSTVGDERAFERLPLGRVKPALALSLHTTHAALRAQLLPNAPRIAPAELVARGDAYARATGYPLQLQWTLMAGVNDGDDEVQALIELLRGRFAMLNLIPYNRVEGLPYTRPAMERAAAMARTLHRAGVLTKLRRSAAQDVDGGCGQLRARTAAGTPAVARVFIARTAPAAATTRSPETGTAARSQPPGCP